MVDLTKYITPTVAAIYQYYSDNAKQGKRAHLGGSEIGNDCSRALWYSFRWVGSVAFDGRMLRLFETGDREEQRLIANLRAVGVTVWDRDPETGEQFRYEDCGGHFGVGLDGVGEGFKESSKTHVLEFKTMNDKNFADIQRNGVRKSKPVYWAQMQIGMYMSELERAFIFVTNKNDDNIYQERVKLEVKSAKSLLDKAASVIFGITPPPRMNDDPSFYLCKFCNFRSTCHENRVPDVSCRTCAHVTPMEDGTWNCGKHHKTLTTDEQRAGCKQHLFIPQAMPPSWELLDAGTTWVRYRNENGEVTNKENSNALRTSSVSS